MSDLFRWCPAPVLNLNNLTELDFTSTNKNSFVNNIISDNINEYQLDFTYLNKSNSQQKKTYVVNKNKHKSKLDFTYIKSKNKRKKHTKHSIPNKRKRTRLLTETPEYRLAQGYLVIKRPDGQLIKARVALDSQSNASYSHPSISTNRH